MPLCEMSKGKQMKKFAILSCSGQVLGRSNSLKEAEMKAEANSEACFVIKVLRLCGGTETEFGAIEKIDAADAWEAPQMVSSEIDLSEDEEE